MDGPLKPVVEYEPDLRDLAVLEERLAEAAIAAAGVGEEQEFGIFVRDDERRVVAGVSGAIWGGCCQLHALWVDQPIRGRGVTRALLDDAEDEARRRGCRLIMGLAYDTLIGDMLERRGWVTVGVIEDCPAGTTTRWSRKDL